MKYLVFLDINSIFLFFPHSYIIVLKSSFSVLLRARGTYKPSSDLHSELRQVTFRSEEDILLLYIAKENCDWPLHVDSSRNIDMTAGQSHLR